MAPVNEELATTVAKSNIKLKEYIAIQEDLLNQINKSEINFKKEGKKPKHSILSK